MNRKVGIIIKWIFVSVRIESIWQHLPILLPSLCCKKGKTISLQNHAFTIHCIVCRDCSNWWTQLLQMTELKIFSETHQTGINFHWNLTKQARFNCITMWTNWEKLNFEESTVNIFTSKLFWDEGRLLAVYLPDQTLLMHLNEPTLIPCPTKKGAHKHFWSTFSCY